MKIIFLGTNGWYSSPTGDTTSILIDAKEGYIVLDAGNGFYKLDQYIKTDKPISLFISHFHLDHVSGLHCLAKFDFKQGIDVYVGQGRAKDFEILVNPPFTIGYKPRKDNVSTLRTQIRLHEMSDPEEQLPFSAKAIKQFHAYTDHGFRIILEGKTIAYTGDCGFTEEARQLAEGADLLICECGRKTAPEVDNWGHFDAKQAATLAKEAKAEQLILNHFGADTFTKIEDRLEAETKAREIFSRTTAARDGMEFEL